MEGVRVIQFGAYYATPLIARCLRGFGCRVTCVCRPETSQKARNERERMQQMFEEVRHGCEMVSVSLPDPERIRDLVKHADVILDGFDHGVAERLGYDFETCKAINSTIVYVSVPGFAELASPKGFEAVIMSSAGVFRDMGINRTLLGIEASYTHLPLASVYGSMYALFACLCALHGEQKGVHIMPLASALNETMA